MAEARSYGLHTRPGLEYLRPAIHREPVGRVLISEPHADTAALLEIVLRRLGHEPVVHQGGVPALAGLDAAVIEPGDAAGLLAAETLAADGVPFVFTSIYSPSRALLATGPSAWLVKPFPLSALERALEQALATRAAT